MERSVTLSGPAALRLGWTALHGFIILALLGEALYCLFQVMVVLQPAGVTGPLFGLAAELPFELVAKRRLYAIEGWIAAIGLAIYLGLTEIRPRLHPHR